MNIHDKLFCAVTEYDRKERAKRGYNPWAIGHYARALQHIRKRVALGQDIRAAILTEFNGRLAIKILKAAELPAMSTMEAKHGCFPRLPELPDEE